jgi:hypothetical protein
MDEANLSSAVTTASPILQSNMAAINVFEYNCGYVSYICLSVVVCLPSSPSTYTRVVFGFASNVTVIGTVPSSAQKLCTLRRATPSSKLFVSVHRIQACFLLCVPN